MLRLCLAIFCCALVSFLAPRPASAQTLSGCKTDSASGGAQLRTEEGNFRLIGTSERPAHLVCDEAEFFASNVEYFPTENRVTAEGDVVFVSGRNRIAAERVEFDTKTKTGTFYKASGTVTVTDQRQANLFGTMEPYAYFWGEELHKLGPDKYRVVRGGFTSCVQPTPRWEVVSGSMDVNLDDHVLIRNPVFKVKGVPILYLPAFYYPLEEDDRSTGFLIPVYGTSTYRGHSISSPFFWAINRSQDLTLTHEWYSKVGQGFTGEYRYVAAPGSSGDASFNYLKESEVTADEADPFRSPRPAQTSYTVRGAMSQALPLGLRAQASANYFSSLVTQQQLQQDVYQATRRDRAFSGALSGTWAGLSATARVDRQDYFYTPETFVRQGSMPRVSLSFAESSLGGIPIYVGASADYARIDYAQFTNDVVSSDTGLTKMDFSPTVRVPFRAGPALTVNSSASWRFTHWTESLVDGVQAEVPLNRRYWEFRSRIVGPVFNRIFDTPGNVLGDRYKHVIEPGLTIQRTSNIEVFDRIVVHGYGDYVIGGVTRYDYDLTNRLYAKKETAREIAQVSVSQTYYSDAKAADYDTRYTSIISTSGEPTNFSPVAFSARVSPTPRVTTDFRADWDVQVHKVRTLSAGGSFKVGEWLDLTGGWSLRRLIPELPAFSNPLYATHYVNGAANVRARNNTVGGHYSVNYDMRNDFFLQQRIQFYYNAQCCGIVAEWQTFNLVGVNNTRGIEDRRFNISFSLAGIGTFSNFLGAFGGGQERRY